MQGVDAGETTWLLVASALVFLMTPGVALWYGGRVRSEKVPSVVTNAFVSIAAAAAVWIAIGHTFAFGPDIGSVVGHGGWIGNLDFLGFRSLGAEPLPLAGSVPAIAFASYEMFVAIFAVALIGGAFGARLKLPGYAVFVAAWVAVVYAPIAHWMYGGGFLGAAGVGALDSGGGAVVHVTAGAAALAVVVVLGRGRHAREEPPTPNLPVAATGGALLWFGWFGLSGAGPAVFAATAVATTQAAAAAGLIGWAAVEWIRRREITGMGAICGALTGLVAITASAGITRPWSALVIGVVAGAAAFFATDLIAFLRGRDPLRVVAIHGIGGVIGMLLAGVFAVGPGAFYSGTTTLLARQAIATGVVIAWSFVVSAVLLGAVDWVVGLREPVDG